MPDECPEDNGIAEGLNAIAQSLIMLGNNGASTPMGAMEALGKSVSDSAERIAASIDNLADAIRETKQP